MKIKQFILMLIFLLLSACCSIDQGTSEINNGKVIQELDPTCKKNIVVQPYLPNSDQIAGFGWEIGSKVTLEIDDPTNNKGADYSDSQFAALTDIECATVNFYPDDDWDLLPGHEVTMTDGDVIAKHIVQYIEVEDINIELDYISGWAAANSEVIVWIEEPATHELKVLADTTGFWVADFSGITDITAASYGAVVQNDDPDTDSHTRIDW